MEHYYPVSIRIEGMTCSHCTSRVHDMLNDLEHTHDVQVSLDDHQAIVQLQSPLDDDTKFMLSEAVEDAGFDVISIVEGVHNAEHTSNTPAPVDEDVTVTHSVEPPADSTPTAIATGKSSRIVLEVRGMTCASCVARVERALADLPNAQSAVVNYATERATVIPSDDVVDEDAFAEELKNAVESSGYEVESWRIDDPNAPAHQSQQHALHTSDGAESSASSTSTVTSRLQKKASSWLRRFLFGLAILPPILLLQMGPMWFGVHLHGTTLALTLFTVAYLTALTLWVTGKPFFQGAWQGLKHGSANMDTLVALGAGVAFTYSLVVTILSTFGHEHSGHVYFDGAAMIVTLISLGKWLEVKARGSASASMEALLSLGAQSATVLQQGQWVTLPVNQVNVGDTIAVKPGEKVPVDAVIQKGSADMNEAMLTGESVPVTRSEGDEIMAATINTDGFLEAEVIRAAGDTALSRIIKQVELAQESKANIQRLADRISAIFVPTIIAIAVLTFVVWFFILQEPLATAIAPAIAVLVVACPCALGLATPTALMVGSSRGAKQGILIREANALEQASRLDALIFDKTGTLTHGKMHVTDITPLDVKTSQTAQDTHDILRLAALLEQGSEHPIAAAILNRADEDGVGRDDESLKDFKVIAGHGVEASIQGERYRLGKPSWILPLYPDIDPQHTSTVQSLREQAKTVVLLADSSTILGVIAVMDTPRDEAKEAIRSLESQGVEVWMVTGDDAQVAHSVAAELGIKASHVKSQVLPGDKAQIVRDIQAQDKVVAMVGDGINDAPALAQADLGIAMGSGADVAMEAAAMTLVGHNLEQVVQAVLLARATYGKIRQNLFWAFGYNVILVPVAALGLLVPALAAGAMALSSVSVVTNSLLLRAKRL